MAHNTLDLTDDIIDVRDIIERYEELEESFGSFTIEERDEMEILRTILEELKGYGGDEQWRGDWYPLTLIREDYFTEYAEELVKDCEGLPRNLPSYIEIDWEATAKNLQVDYSTIEINGTDYFYR